MRPAESVSGLAGGDSPLPWIPLPPHLRDRAFAASGSVLLESSRPSLEQHQSLLFTDPEAVLTLSSGDDAPRFFWQIADALAAGLHVAGYFTYECGAAMQGLPHHPLATGNALARVGLYREPLVFDHRAGAAQAQDPLQHTKAWSEDLPQLDLALLPEASAEAYEHCIQRIQQWIADGDTYQVNYTTALRSTYTGDAQTAYERFLQEQAGSFGAVLTLDADRTILSFSPELFFEVDRERTIRTRPMKGTLERKGADPATLQSDAKNRAEHLMIVDLLRNDLGRICQTGSVHVPHLFRVEAYRTLYQMVSTVEGKLLPDADWLAVFRALFPSGSITGAPKRHTMELIHRLETAPRDVYTGAIGYFAPNGRAAFSVAIRTLLLQHGTAALPSTIRMGVGGGIVADSTAAAEYAECLLKANFVQRASDPLCLVETMRAQGKLVAQLDRHLDRLAASARSLGFPCVQSGALQAIGTALANAGDGPLRLRLALDRAGAWQAAATPYVAWPPLLRIRMAATCTDAADPALRHKTTHRRIYDREYSAALAEGFHEALFLNTEGLLTEGCITNLFVYRDGQVVTPPCAAGVLPGILRERLLHAKLAGEASLALADLEGADAVLLGNSLRGVHAVRDLMIQQDRVLQYDEAVITRIAARLNAALA